MKLIIATRNAHKTQEIAQILPDCYEVLSLADFPDAPEVEETGSTFAANAALKALGISEYTDGLILADDSGLCVDALGGEPGIYSARYAGEHGNDAANNAFLLDKLRALPSEQAPFRARFVCAMCLAQQGQEIAAFEGTVEGHITLNPEGTEGFGYDPLFIPDGYDTSFGILPADIKNSISHRSNALKMLSDTLKNIQ
ncbi:MAG: RdgB/HAM1 family non-canonical purine NTP pyrophosphatase [Akkermansia sp.]